MILFTGSHTSPVNPNERVFKWLNCDVQRERSRSAIEHERNFAGWCPYQPIQVCACVFSARWDFAVPRHQFGGPLHEGLWIRFNHTIIKSHCIIASAWPALHESGLRGISELRHPKDRSIFEHSGRPYSPGTQHRTHSPMRAARHPHTPGTPCSRQRSSNRRFCW